MCYIELSFCFIDKKDGRFLLFEKYYCKLYVRVIDRFCLTYLKGKSNNG